MGFDSIIALDLGKFKSVACVLEVKTRQHRFETIDTTPQRLHELFVANVSDEPSRTLVVIECCDAAGWVHDLATSLGLAVMVANCRHEAWRWNKVKRKTDRDDALKLAKMALNDELPTVHMPSPYKRQKRRLILHRRSLVARRTQCKNSIRSIFSQQGLTHLLPRTTKAWTKAGIEQLAAHAKPLDACDLDHLWRGRLHLELALLEVLHEQILTTERKLDELARDDAQVKLLETMPGVGTRLAETVANCLDDPHRFKSAGQVASYAGLVPKQMERDDETHRPDHASWVDAAARHAGGGGVDGLASQRLGQVLRGADQPRDEAAQEDCHRRAGAKGPGDPVGDAA